MNTGERAAYNAGIEAARQMAMVAAVTLEYLDDAREVRQRAAAAALQGLAEGARALMLEATDSSERCISVVLYNGPEAGAGQGAGP